MSILNLFNNQRSAANERKDKELIRKTLYKDTSFVDAQVDGILYSLDRLIGEYERRDRRRPPQAIRNMIKWQSESVFDLLDIDLEMEAANFENQFNPSNEELMSHVKDAYHSISPFVNSENPIEDFPELTGKIVDEKVDDVWANLVSDKTGKRYSQQILLWWSRGSTAQNLGEDLPAIVDSIKLFEKHKKSLPKNNISQYKRWDQLNEVLEPIRVAEAAENRDLRLESGETVDELVGLTEEQREFMDPKQMRFPGTEYPQSSGNVVVKQIKTFEEAKALGEGTTWCFTNSPNYYSQYSNRGPIYIVLDNGDPKVGIGIDGDWDIEIKNSNNRHLTGKEEDLYGPIVERITQLNDMVEALENQANDDEQRVIDECEYCGGDIWGYGNDDDEYFAFESGTVCESCYSEYGCRAGYYEHGWKNSDDTFEDPRDEEVGGKISSCWSCAESDELVTQCAACEDIIFKNYPYKHGYSRNFEIDNYFISMEGDLCEDCGAKCIVCEEGFLNTSKNKEEDFICNECRQMDFPEVEQQPVYEQPVGDWEGEFFPQGDPNIIHYKALGE